jgi:sec-independent protein translocase protein TatB
MLNVGPGELIAILALALIVLGPNRLPEAVRTAGRLMGELRRISSGFQEELRSALEDSDVERDLDRLRTGPEAVDRPELGPVDDVVETTAVEAGDHVDAPVASNDGDGDSPVIEDHEVDVDDDADDDDVIDGTEHFDDGPPSSGDERAAS